MRAVGQDAPAQPAVCYVVNAAQVTEHLRGGHTFFVPLSGVGTIEGTSPALRLDYVSAVLEALPGAERHCFLLGFGIREQKRIGHVVSPLCREVLPDQHLGPAERFEERPDQFFFGLRLGRVPELAKIHKEGVEAITHIGQDGIVEPFPRGRVADAFEQEITREEAAIQQCAAPRPVRGTPPLWNDYDQKASARSPRIPATR